MQTMTSNKKVVIIDYKLGNLFSVKQACDTIGISSKISSNKEDINNADALILPGVGAFIEAMKNLEELSLINSIVDNVTSGKPFFGICLGMQLIFTKSEEFGSGNGLGLLDGVIKRFPNTISGKEVKVPQIAWNKIYNDSHQWQNTPFQDLKNDEYMYFVHSYYVKPEQPEITLSSTDYEGLEYCSSIQKNNIFATQFHPEKSAEKGISIYNNWALLNKLK